VCLVMTATLGQEPYGVAGKIARLRADGRLCAL
jgi:hypothetical protein